MIIPLNALINTLINTFINTLFKKAFLFFIICFFSFTQISLAENFYSKGSLPANTASNWNTQRDGLGTDAPSFGSGNTFTIQNGHSMTTAAGSWDISGTGILIIEFGGVWTNSITNVTIGTFTINGGALYIHNAEASIPGSIKRFNSSNNDGTANGTVEMLTGFNPGANISFGNVKISAHLDSDVSEAGQYSDVRGNFNFQTTGSGEFRLTNDETHFHRIGGNLAISSGTLNIKTGSGSIHISIGGNLHITGGTLTQSGGLSEINFNGLNSRFIFTGGNITNPLMNFAVSTNSFLTLENDLYLGASRNLTVDGTIDLNTFIVDGQGVGVVVIGEGNIKLKNSIASQLTDLSLVPFWGTYEFTGSEMPSGTYSNIRLSEGQMTSLSGNVTITGTLHLINGILITGANTLTIGTSTSNVGNISRFYGGVRGTLRRWFAAGTINDAVFPLDNGSSNYVGVTISFTTAPAAGGTLTASYHTSGSGSLPSHEDGNYIHAKELGVNFVNLSPQYWTITAANGLESNSGAYSITLIANSMGVSTTSYEYTGIVKRTNNTQPWEWNFANHVTTTSPSAIPNLGGKDFTTFSDFAVGGNQDNLLPVELSAFTSSVSGVNVRLNWITSSEENNSGFDVEKKSLNGSWVKIGNIAGNGTSNITNSYSFEDRNLQTGKYNYRLKQIDYNGNYQYHELSNEVIIGVPAKFNLSQNYPNPFNPSTNINYELPLANFVSMKIYDMMGREVMQLVNEVKEAGYYTVKFDASMLSSGMYFYKIQAGDFVSTKKMMLVK